MIKFGTGGWRAVIGEDFIKENICKVAGGILRLMQEENKTDKPVLIGFDRRFLSESAARWVAEVLAKGGIKVWFLNRSAPTPLIMHTVKDKGLYFGLEITASHNPANYNGIKLIVEEGRDAPLETTEKLEKFEKMIWEMPMGYAVSKISHTFFEHREMIDVFGADEICSFAIVPFWQKGLITSYFISNYFSCSGNHT